MGGRLYICDTTGHSSGSASGYPFEVLDECGKNFYENGGKVCFSTYGEARGWAESRDIDVMDADWDHVRWLRGE